MQTAEQYVALYAWFYKPSSVHKILIQAGDIINSVFPPLRLISVEAQELRKNDLRNFRGQRTRKNSRKHPLED